MSDEALALFLAIGMIFSVVMFCRAFMEHRRARRPLEIARAERIRSKFAEARKILLDAVYSGELDPRSTTFRTLYFFNTAIMRRRDQYESLWKQLLVAGGRAGSRENSSKLKEESRSWGSTTKKAALATIEAMELMLQEHSAILRLFVRLLSMLSVRRQVSGWFLLLNQRVQEHIRREIRQKRKQHPELRWIPEPA